MGKILAILAVVVGGYFLVTKDDPTDKLQVAAKSDGNACGKGGCDDISESLEEIKHLRPGTKKFKKKHFQVLKKIRKQCDDGDMETCYWLSHGLKVLGKKSKSREVLKKACPTLLKSDPKDYPECKS